MNILITGATGFIGSHITTALLSQGHNVTLCVRTPETAVSRWPGIKAITVDFSHDHDEALWYSRLEGIDIVINAVGIIRETASQQFADLHTRTPCALFRACGKKGVKKVIQISALGADKTAFSQYHLSKRAADKCLMTQGVNWLVLMPSIVYGSGAKSMALFKALSSLSWIPIIDDGNQKVQPIHINDLVSAVQRFIESDQYSNLRIELVGPKPVSIKIIYTKLREWLGLGQPRFVSVSYAISLQLAKMGGFLGNSPMTKEAVQMLQNGNTADVSAFVRYFNFCPRSLEQSLLELPSQQSDRWHAKLYFLKPLLRLSIAFLWLFTGIVSVFVYPEVQSFMMLGKTGIVGIWAPVILYGAAATDFLLGFATLISFRIRIVGLIQIVIILIYSIIITFSQPLEWIHPFGPVSKNIPLIFATMIMMALEKK